MTIHGSSIDDASKGYITIHSLDPQDAPIADAMRAMVSSNKGAQPGAEARGQFDALMQSASPRGDVTFETGTVGGIPGLWVYPARRFVKEGAYVFITGRRQAELDAAAKLMSGHVTAVRADASNLDDLDKLFAQIKREKGRLDVVYANAGGGGFAPIGGITEEHFDQTFNTNVKGTLFTVQKALPLIPDAGSIIMTCSAASSTAMPAFSVYSATKAAIRSFARCWTLDLKERKIRVNVISPGPIETPGVAGLAPDEEQRKGLYSMLASQVPLGRMGQPDEVAKVAVFLASDDSSFVTGIELFADGGMAQV